jgi:hypothetical protein
MNWLIIALDILFAMIAAILSILGFRTYQSIKNLNVGKSFWVPIFLSGIFFVLGSAARILSAFFIEYGSGAMTFIDEVVQVSSLLAIGILLSSIYGYSRKVKTAVKVTKVNVHKETELTTLEKQTNDLLKQVEKLKRQINSKE